MNSPKPPPSKVRLKRETLRVLSAGDLTKVVGGFIMKDSVIVKTSTRVAAPPSTVIDPLEWP